MTTVARAATTRSERFADAFNHMLDRLADDIAAQRGFIADASPRAAKTHSP